MGLLQTGWLQEGVRGERNITIVTYSYIIVSLHSEASRNFPKPGKFWPFLVFSTCSIIL
jgi:hypothetical protein